MNYHCEFDFNSSMQAARPDIINQHLTTLSTGEIQRFFNRVNFYLEHFTIVNKKQRTLSSENKVNFLRKLRSILKDEIDSRCIKAHV